MRELGLVYSYIYRGFFSNFRITESCLSPGTAKFRSEERRVGKEC